MKKYPPISEKFPHLIHGADYNPDQWLAHPEVLKEDIRLMKLSHSNAMSIGIFSWSQLEPEEGQYQFEWLDNIIDQLYENGIYTILATPSGARPAWLSQKYPEVLRIEKNGIRRLHGIRHNHCFTSPVYREKVQAINEQLAKRYSHHPGVIAWHISNEYNGECYCTLCQDAFRNWVKTKYKTLENLNEQWWTGFWSHTYTDWSQVEPPQPRGEDCVHGLNLDWKRFITDQTIDFYHAEIEPIRKEDGDLPITTNFMGTSQCLDYFKFAKEVDVVSWDSYPEWHHGDAKWKTGMKTSFLQDLNRGLKDGKPFMLMESTPSMTNWQAVAKLKRPGMHLLSSLQAVAHGSDTVQYFQWRKSRGSSEKFHGAVVDHCGHEHTRVFKDVTDVGYSLSQLDDIVGCRTHADVALLYDWNNSWAISDIRGYVKKDKNYTGTCVQHYEAFWRKGISVDIVSTDTDLSGYKVLILPMLYLLTEDYAKKVKSFVEKGGTLVTTYMTGLVNENDLCYLEGCPGPLKDVLGIWVEETDCLFGHENNTATITWPLGDKSKQYNIHSMCDLLHLETATALGKYDVDFYAGMPALTRNEFGQGQAYYIAFRNNDDLQLDFYDYLIEELHIQSNLPVDLPTGVTVQTRTDGGYDYTFIMNFNGFEESINLSDKAYDDLLTGETYVDSISLQPYGIKILKSPYDHK